MTITRTLAIIKPDATGRFLQNEIFGRIGREKFGIGRSFTRKLARCEVERLYAEHVGRPFYGPLLDFMTSGQSIVAIISRENAVGHWRSVLGATDSRDAAPGTLRDLYGDKGPVCAQCGGRGVSPPWFAAPTDANKCPACNGHGSGPNIIFRNAAHGSDSDEAAEREIGIFFPTEDRATTISDVAGKPAPPAPAPVLLPSPVTLADVADEVRRARTKFPGGRFLLAALAEEVGELAEAIVAKDRDDTFAEAIQVAAVAIRIAEEGDDTTYQIDALIQLVASVGRVARYLLQRRKPDLMHALRIADITARSMRHGGDPTFNDITDEEAKP